MTVREGQGRKGSPGRAGRSPCASGGEQELTWLGDFPGGPMVKNPSSNAGDVGSIPGLRSKPVRRNY